MKSLKFVITDKEPDLAYWKANLRHFEKLLKKSKPGSFIEQHNKTEIERIKNNIKQLEKESNP